MHHVIKVWYQNDWGLYGRRDERIARELSRDPRIGKVLHVEPPLALSRLRMLTAAPSFEHNLELNVKRLEGTQQDGIHLFTPCLPDESVPADAAGRMVVSQIVQRVQQLDLLSAPLILWLSAPAPVADLLLEVLGPHAAFIVTEIEDDHRCYFAPDSSQYARAQAIYERLVRCSDIAFSNSAPMVAEWRALQPEFHHVPNAVDAREYARPLPRSPAIEMLARPCVTYVGNLELRLDWEILSALAASLTQGTLVLVGAPGKTVRELASRHACVKLLGPVRASQVPAILGASDVLILPHAVNAMTRGMDPQKLHEYLASGRPVVATPVQGTAAYEGLIAIAERPAEFIHAVQSALASDSPARQARRVAAAVRRSWHTVVPEMLNRVLAVTDAGSRLKAYRKRRYHSMSRPEVCELVPTCARRVLDIGCGTGALGVALKQSRELHVTGIEMDAAAADEAARVLDRVHCGDALHVLATLAARSFDAVVLADVLEHVADPGALLAQVKRVLEPNGHAILSVPNVRHWSVVREILEGDFQYREAGILDAGHLRFYTRKSLLRLLEKCDFHPVSLGGSSWNRECMPDAIVAALRASGLDVATLAEESAVHQFLVVAAPNSAVPLPTATRRADLAVVTTRAPFAESLNRAIRECSQAFVAIVAPGVVLNDASTERLLQHLERDHRIGLVAPSTDDPSFGDAVTAAVTTRFPDIVEDTAITPAFCCVLRRELLQAVGAFVDFGGAGEAEWSDYTMRLRRLGYRLVTARDVFVPHAPGAPLEPMVAKRLAAKWREDPILAGIAAEQAGDLTSALRHFEASMRQYPECVDGSFHTATCLVRLGRLSDALEHVERYLARHRRSREALLVKGAILLKLSSNDAARAVLQILERECYLPASLSSEIEVIKAALSQPTPV